MIKSIAVSGKGGTGKSTIAALIIDRLIKRNITPVLAVDADPDSNLGILLGHDNIETIGDLREDLLKQIKNFPQGMTKSNYIEFGLHQIIDEREGYDLITMGRGEGAGCYCYINSIIKKFCDDLAPSYSWLVIDNEAGLEHLSRRTTANIDALIITVTESPLSFNCAEKIKDIVSEMSERIGNVFVVCSMVKKERLAEVHRRVDKLDFEVIADIPKSEELENLMYNHKSIYELNDGKILSAIDIIIDRIGAENEDS